tara:strand:+ start:1066 stop:1221 length:156 start_codon:yes stop_codon:yes gene_type:complete
MVIGETLWSGLKTDIEKLLSKDPNITDVIISYQVKKTERGRHYANIKIKTE